MATAETSWGPEIYQGLMVPELYNIQTLDNDQKSGTMPYSTPFEKILFILIYFSKPTALKRTNITRKHKMYRHDGGAS